MLDVEDRPTLVIHEAGELRVEVARAERRRDADRRSAGNLHQRHEHLKEDDLVHVGGLLAVDHIGRNTLERVR